MAVEVVEREREKGRGIRVFIAPLILFRKSDHAYGWWANGDWRKCDASSQRDGRKKSAFFPLLKLNVEKHSKSFLSHFCLHLILTKGLTEARNCRTEEPRISSFQKTYLRSGNKNMSYPLYFLCAPTGEPNILVGLSS